MRGKKAKKIISMALVCLMVSSNIGLAQGKDYENHWAENSIQSWVDKGYVKGYADGSFKPEGDITRAEFISIVNRSFGFTEQAEVSYKDVKPSHWAYGEFKRASAAKYIGGFEDGTLRPNSKITRQEVAAIMSRLLNLPDAQMSEKFLSLKDVSQIPQWSAGPVSAVVDKGYMNLRNDSFKGALPATRAEVISALDKSYMNAIAIKYDKPGTYTAGVVNGNVEISAKGVILENTTINGNLIISEGVESGEVTLKNVTIKGDTIVKGGGMNTITLQDSFLRNLIVNKKDGKVRILAKGSTEVSSVDLQSGAKLESSDKTANNFGDLVVSPNLAASAPIILAANFRNVTVQSANNAIQVQSGTIKNLEIAKTAKDALINLAEGVKVDRVEVNAPTKIDGKGKIETATVNVSGSVITAPTTNVEKSEGVEVKTETPSGGGGGGTTPAEVAVSAITVTGAGDATTITADGGTLQMSAAVSPANASNKGVTWSVANGTGSATISSAGLLTAVTNGTVTVKATSVSTPAVSGTIVVTISGQEAAFTPGEGGMMPSFTPFTSEANKIGGLYVYKNHRYYPFIYDGTARYYHFVELHFPTPESIGATGYKLQYSDDGDTWANYQTWNTDTGKNIDLVTGSGAQDNFSVSNPSGNYSYRLLVIGGAKDGCVSNTVAADIPTVDSQFTAWSLDESFTISGVMYPFVGRGLKASFTAKVANYDNLEPEYKDEHMNFQWYRVNPVTYEMTPIPEANNLTYITTEADLGYRLLIRATGEKDIGGYAQIFGGITVMPNDAYITNISAEGFTLNLFKSVDGLGQSDLILTDYKFDPVEISSVTPGDSPGIYHIAATLDLAKGPFNLKNNSGFWKIASQMPGGHGGHGRHEGVQVAYGEIFTHLEIIDSSAEKFYACVYDTNNGYVPILGLTKEDFTLKDASGNVVAFNFNDPDLRDPEIPGSEYLLSPAGHDVFAAGDYTLTFAKSGHKTASKEFTVGNVIAEAAAMAAINAGGATLQDYENAEIIGVSAGNLADVNTAVETAKTTKGSDLDKAEIQGAVASVVDAADQEAVNAEVAKYEAAATINSDVAVSTDVTSTVAKLQAEQTAGEGITLSYSVAPGTYLEVAEGAVKVKAQKSDAGDGTETVTITFTKGGKTATKEVTVTIKTSYDADQEDVDAAIAKVTDPIASITVAGGDGATAEAKIAAVKAYVEGLEGMAALGVTVAVEAGTNSGYKITITKGAATPGVKDNVAVTAFVAS